MTNLLFSPTFSFPTFYTFQKKQSIHLLHDYSNHPLIVYYKNGIKEIDGSPVTPVIHRAMAWVDVLDNGNIDLDSVKLNRNHY